MSTPGSPHSPSAAIFLSWLRQFNQKVVFWVAALSWRQLIGLGLIVLIASSWIGSTLNLRHERVRSVSVTTPDTEDEGDEDGSKPMQKAECNGEHVRIGGPNGILICDERKVQVPAPSASVPAGVPDEAATAAQTPVGPAAVPPPPVPPKAGKPNTSVQRDEEWRPRKEIRRTWGGWLGDLVSATLVAIFAYFIAAKIIVRKTAESEAKLRVATVNAEQEALQRQLVQARLKLLQAQVEPHFLFNTLAAVDYLIETDAPRASVMQKKLITYLRGALPQMRQESSTLGREMNLIRAYLDLIKMRIEDRLEVDIQVPPILMNAVFPPMILQSLVENAIKHGIEPKPEGGRITILARTQDEQLWVEVSDTGVGLPDGDIFGTSTNGTGLGLDNIRKRLALLYPGASRIELRSGHEGGTTVRLVIPYQTLSHDESRSKADPV